MWNQKYPISYSVHCHFATTTGGIRNIQHLILCIVILPLQRVESEISNILFCALSFCHYNGWNQKYQVSYSVRCHIGITTGGIRNIQYLTLCVVILPLQWVESEISSILFCALSYWHYNRWNQKYPISYSVRCHIGITTGGIRNIQYLTLCVVILPLQRVESEISSILFCVLSYWHYNGWNQKYPVSYFVRCHFAITTGGIRNIQYLILCVVILALQQVESEISTILFCALSFCHYNRWNQKYPISYSVHCHFAITTGAIRNIEYLILCVVILPLQRVESEISSILFCALSYWHYNGWNQKYPISYFVRCHFAITTGGIRNIQYLILCVVILALQRVESEISNILFCALSFCHYNGWNQKYPVSYSVRCHIGITTGGIRNIQYLILCVVILPLQRVESEISNILFCALSFCHYNRWN